MQPTAFSMLRTPPWRLLLSRWPWLSLLHLLVGTALGVLTVAAVVLFPVLPAWVRLLAEVEARRAVVFPPRTAGGLLDPWRDWSRWRSRALSLPGWRQAVVAIMGVLVAAEGFLLVVVWPTAVVTASRVATGHGVRVTGDERVLVLDGAPAVASGLVLGLVSVVLLAYLTTATAALGVTLVRLLTDPDTEVLAHRVEMLEDARVTLSDAFEAERRRIERDLHDGPQQHLTLASMRLGLARAPGTTPDERDALLARAQDEIDLAADSLRAALHGLRPRALVERGLVAAVQELADGAPLTVTVRADLADRLPPATESSLLFVVSEFLTNAYRHAGARTVDVVLAGAGEGVTLRLTDDGRGGADPARGTGLTGIAHRARLLGGHASLTSPVGGPTVLELRCPAPAREPQEVLR